MPVMDEFQEEREKIKTASPEKKWQYFKDYYLKWVIGIGIGAVIVIYFVVSIITKKDDVPFTEKYVEDPKKQQILLDTSSHISAGEVSDNAANYMKYGYEDEERVMALAYSDGIDLMISGQDVIERYMEAEWFIPLDGVLDADTLAQYDAEGRLLYFEDVPVAVCVDTAKLLNDNYIYDGEGTPSLYAAFGGGSKHMELAVEFLKFIQ